MTREQARKAAEVMLAYANGKKVETMNIDGKWEEIEGPSFDWLNDYRVKPEPTSRPFNSVEECWNEMQKHQPFGWVKSNGHNGAFKGIISLAEGFVGVAEQDNFDLCEMWEAYTFADGQPFGIMEGEE